MSLKPPIPTGEQSSQKQAEKQKRSAFVPVAMGLAIVLGLTLLAITNQPAKDETRPFNIDPMSLPEFNPEDAYTVQPNDGPVLLGDPESMLQQYTTGEVLPNDVSMDTEPAYLPALDQLIDANHESSTHSSQPQQPVKSMKATRLKGFARSSDTMIDEYAFWKVQSNGNDPDIRQILAWYQAAAKGLQFQLIKQSNSDSRSPDHLLPIPPQKNDASHIELKSKQKQSLTHHLASQSLIFTRKYSPDEKDHKLRPGSDILIIRARDVPNKQIAYITIWHRSSTQESIP